ncbi:hypothetical protein DPMN_077166, partial [Dreissena polymorpha]
SNVYIYKSEDLIVHCFVLNHHGELRKDNCSQSYSSVCVNATVHDTIQYSGQDSKVPNYDPTNELVQPSNAPHEGHDNVHYDVIPDDIREREATSYTSLQVC